MAKNAEQLQQPELKKEYPDLSVDINQFEGMVDDADKASDKDLKDRLNEIRIFTGIFFKDHPGKWSENDIKSVYEIAKRAGIIGAKDNFVTATQYVRSVVKELEKHVDSSTFSDKAFRSKLLYEKTHFNFSRQIDYEWLGESALTEMNNTNAMLVNWAETLTQENFDYILLNLRNSWLDEYTEGIMSKAPTDIDKRIDFAKGKVKSNLASNFYFALVPNRNVGIKEKKRAMDLCVKIVDAMPGLFGEKRAMLAEATGVQLETKKGKKSGKGSKKVAGGPEKKRGFTGPRTASERVREVEHKGLSVASFNSEDVVLFDYQEGVEKQLVMPDAMKVQLNSIALIHDLAEMLLKGGKIELTISNRVTSYLNYLQNDLVEYYKGEDYDGKTPFDLEKELVPIMSGNRFKEFVNATNKIALSPARTGKMTYRAEFLKLLSGKSLADMDEVKKAGFAIAWMERHVFEDHMSARGLMTKLLHKDVMVAREKLPPETKEQLYEKAYNDARKSITSMFSDGDIRDNFRANFTKRYLEDNHGLPDYTQVDQAYARFFSFNFEAKHLELYDNYLTLTAFSDKYMKDQLPGMSGVDKNIYDEFCDSTDPNNDFFKLSDEGRAVLSGITKEVVIMAVAMVLTAGVGFFASKIVTAVRGLSMMKNAATFARYAAEAAMYTGTVTAEATTFYDVNALAHGEATIAGTLLIDKDWRKAGVMLASEMPMFMLLGGAHYAVGFAKTMSGEAKALMAAAKKYPKYAKETKDVLALAKSSPKKAIQAMENALAKGGLPKEVAQRFTRVVDDVYILSDRYRGVLGKISNPFVQKTIGVLVVNLNFDAVAIMLGTYLKEKIHPTDGGEAISAEERGAIEAVLLEWGKSYLMAAGFKTAFAGVGKLARKVPEVLEQVLPQGLRERLMNTYKNAKGEFIGRDGLINMLLSKLEVGGFDTAIAQMEEAKVLILTVKEVLLVTSGLPEGKAKKFLKTCKRMMSQSERQLVVDEVTAMQKAHVLPEGFARGKSEMPMDRFRNAEGFVGKMITAQILGLVLKVFSPEVAAEPVERPVAEAVVDVPSAKEIAKRLNASKDSRSIIVNTEAKNQEEAFKDFSEFYFGVTSQDSIFAGMEKAGVNPENISALKAAYSSLPDLVKNYCRFFGSNVDGKFVIDVAIDQKGLSGIDEQKGKKLAEVVGMKDVQRAGFGPGWIALLLYLIPTLGRAIQLAGRTYKRGAGTNDEHSFTIGKWGALGRGLGWPVPAYKRLRGEKKSSPETAHPMPALADIMADKHEHGAHLGLSAASHGKLTKFYEDLITIFKAIEFKRHNEAKKIFEALVRWKYFKLRLKEIDAELGKIGEDLPKKEAELATCNAKLAESEAEKARLVGRMENNDSRSLSELFKAAQADIAEAKAEKAKIDGEIKELKKKKKALDEEKPSVETQIEELNPEKLRFPVSKINSPEALRDGIEALLRKEGLAGKDRGMAMSIVDAYIKDINANSNPDSSFRKIKELRALIDAKRAERDRAIRTFPADIAKTQSIVDSYNNLVRQLKIEMDKTSRFGLTRLSLRADQLEFLRNHPGFKKALGLLLLGALLWGGKGLIGKAWDAIPDPRKPEEATGAPPAPVAPTPPVPTAPSKPPLERPGSAPIPPSDDVKPEEATGASPAPVVPKTVPPERPSVKTSDVEESGTPKKGVKALKEYLRQKGAEEKAVAEAEASKKKKEEVAKKSGK